MLPNERNPMPVTRPESKKLAPADVVLVRVDDSEVPGIVVAVEGDMVSYVVLAQPTSVAHRDNVRKP